MPAFGSPAIGRRRYPPRWGVTSHFEEFREKVNKILFLVREGLGDKPPARPTGGPPRPYPLTATIARDIETSFIFSPEETRMKTFARRRLGRALLAFLAGAPAGGAAPADPIRTPASEGDEDGVAIGGDGAA